MAYFSGRTVVTANIADGAITTAKLADDAVTTAKIADSAITTGKILDATIANADMNATGGHNIEVVRKTANEDVNNSVTLQNDDSLVSASLPASSVWQFEMRISYVSASTTPNIKFDLVLPSGAEFKMVGIGKDTGGTVQLFACNDGNSAPRLGSYDTLATYQTLTIIGTIVIGGTAGTCQVQWAQNTATVENTTLQASSCNMILRRIS